jgi:nitrogen fixation/metabolism regulation signal transduction histidine kinase
MILLVLVASVLIAGVTIYQYGEQSKDYHQDRLERKEEQIKENIRYTLQRTTYVPTTENLHLIFKDEIYQIADVLNVNFNIYDLEGNLIKSSRPKFENDAISLCLQPNVLNNLEKSVDARYLEEKSAAGNKFQASYTYITDAKFKPIGILNLPYFEDNSFNDKELKEFLLRLGGVYLFMLFIAILLAYFISKYITRSLQTISDKMTTTYLTKSNEKIYVKNPTVEIGSLIDSYNAMIDELEISAIKLAKSEREQAWREMAKQVAHEIKNPLTPMRLTVQSFERKFDVHDPEITIKVGEYSKTLIQQIDTMSSIAGAFSNFAEMPAQQNETLNVVQVVKLALDIFNENFIHFIAEKDEIISKLDRTQLIRVITNLIKNAIQAIPDVATPKILVTVSMDGEFAEISVADNGIGIAAEFREKIFEPKFTTKTSGMGLGLGMVKNIVETYNGTISFTSQLGNGTVFTVKFPRFEK